MAKIRTIIQAWILFSAILFLCVQQQAFALGTNQPSALNQLLTLSSIELENCDIARMNLLCADGLPGAEGVHIETSLALLDQWAAHIKAETERNFHHFQENPAYYYNSEAFYKMLVMSVVLYEDYRVRYNSKWIVAPTEIQADDHFFADSRDILLHGLTGSQRMGTCSSMPVLYIALGRRLGYPLKLVKAKGHLFMRWEDAKERFDMDATGKGLDRYDDAHFKQWPFPLSDQEIKDEEYLKSHIGGWCSPGDDKLVPSWKENQVLYAQNKMLLSQSQPSATNAVQVVTQKPSDQKGAQ